LSGCPLHPRQSLKKAAAELVTDVRTHGNNQNIEIACDASPINFFYQNRSIKYKQ